VERRQEWNWQYIVEYIKLSKDQLIEKLGLNIKKCPVCGCKKYVIKELLPRNIKSPPIY